MMLCCASDRDYLVDEQHVMKGEKGELNQVKPDFIGW